MFTFADFQQASKLFDSPLRTIDKHVRDGLVPIYIAPGKRGRGNRRQFDFCGLMAIGVVQALRKQGATIDALRPIGKFFCSTDFNTLGSEIAQGRSILVSGAGQARLVTPAARIRNNNQDGELLIVVDLAAASQRLVDGLLAHGLLGSSPATPATPARIASTPSAN